MSKKITPAEIQNMFHLANNSRLSFLASYGFPLLGILFAVKSMYINTQILTWKVINEKKFQL